MTLQARGQAFLNRTRATAAGVAVTYTRPGSMVCAATLTAVVGRDDRDRTDAPAPDTRVDDRERDYLIPLAALQQAGFGEPQAGDRIREIPSPQPGCWPDETWYEVRNRENAPAWVFSDLGRTLCRIHTRKANAR